MSTDGTAVYQLKQGEILKKFNISASGYNLYQSDLKEYNEVTLVKGLNMVVIISCAAVGGVIVIAGLTVLIIWLVKRKKTNYAKTTDEEEGITIHEENQHLDEL